MTMPLSGQPSKPRDRARDRSRARRAVPSGSAIVQSVIFQAPLIAVR
jgi:hypothetical protein